MADADNIPEELSFEEVHGHALPEELTYEQAHGQLMPETWGDWAKKEAGAFATGVGEVIPGGQDIPAAIAASLAGTSFAPSYVPEEGSWSDKFNIAKRAQMAAAKRAGEMAPGAKMAGIATGIAGSIPLMEVAAPAEAAIATKLAPKVGSTLSEIASTGAMGAGWGALQGAGEGVSFEERFKNALSGAEIGGALGAGLSAAGKIASKLNQSITARPLTEAEKSAERLGTPLPRFLGTDSPWQKRFATYASSMPVGGGRIQKSAKEAKEGLESAIDSLTGRSRPTPYEAGTTAKEAIAEWMKPQSAKIMERLYGQVDNLVNPRTRVPLTNVRRALSGDRLKNVMMGLVETDASYAPMAEQALSKTSGLTYDGIKNLRTRVIEMLDSPSLLPAGTNTKELLSFKNALTADLENVLERSGPAAKAAWEKANRVNVLVQNRRNNLAKIIGEKGDAEPERVFERITTMASGSSGASLNRLKMARKSMPPDEWEHVTSGVIRTLGRNKAGEFNPVTFVTQYSAMPEASKSIMFGPAGNPVRQSLDDILNVAAKFKEMSEYANPSGTAKVATGIALLANPFGLLYKGPLSAAVLGKVLSKPKTAPLAARVISAFEQDVRKAVDPQKANSATQIALRDFMTSFSKEPILAEDNERPQRASGGKIGNRDYPARKLSRVEKALKRAQDALAMETKPIMNVPDEAVAQALHLAKDK